MALHQKRAEANVQKFVEIQTKASQLDSHALQIEVLKKDRDERIAELRAQIGGLESKLNDSLTKERESSIALDKLQYVHE